MRLTWVLLALLEGTSAIDTYTAVALKEGCTGQVGCKGFYRALKVTTSPPNSVFVPASNVTGLSVGAFGAQVAATNTEGKASVDVAGFRFRTPADNSDNNKGLSFYFGYLGLSGQWDTSAKTANVAGALAEVVSTLSSINVWYDNDGQTGFKWDIGQVEVAKRYDVFNCSAGEAKKYDTFDPLGKIDLKDLVWTPIDHTRVACSSVAGLEPTAECDIHTLRTSGAQTAGAGPVITFTARIASQPVLINKVLHGPGFAKFDVEVAFPWPSFQARLYAPAKAKLALIAVNAGKSGTFAAAAQRNAAGEDSLVFAASSQARAYYSYKSSAIVNSVAAAPQTVSTQVITGQQIRNFDCPLLAPCFPNTFGIVAILKLYVDAFELFGWKTSLTIHALGTSFQPANVFWDPTVGADNNSNLSSASAAIPSLMFLASLLFY